MARPLSHKMSDEARNHLDHHHHHHQADLLPVPSMTEVVRMVVLAQLVLSLPSPCLAHVRPARQAVMSMLTQTSPPNDDVETNFTEVSLNDSFLMDATNYSKTSNESINETCEVKHDSSKYDFREYDYPGSGKKQYDWEDYFRVMLYVITIPAAFFGNAAVVFAVAAKRTLRVTVNLYLANLAVADILICLFCMWTHLVSYLTLPAYVLGPLLCRFNGYAQMTCLTSSVLTLSAISCDRYMAIMHPLRSRVTKQRTGAVITTIWIFSFLIALPLMLYRRLENFQWKNYTEPVCMDEWPSTALYDASTKQCVRSHPLKMFYYTLVSTTLFFVPVFIMLTAYSAICWKLWVNKMPGEANLANLQQQKKSKHRAVKMVVVVLLVFVICWLPLQLVVLYPSYFHTPGEYYSYFIAYSNSAFNPLIYGGFNKNFRDALCSHWLCTIWCCQHPRTRSDRLKRQRPSLAPSNVSALPRHSVAVSHFHANRATFDELEDGKHGHTNNNNNNNAHTRTNMLRRASEMPVSHNAVAPSRRLVPALPLPPPPATNMPAASVVLV